MADSGNVHVHRQLTVNIDAEIPRRVDDWYDSGQQRNVFDDDLVQLLFGAKSHHLCLRWVES